MILWRIHTRPKETMRLTVKNRLVASESTRLATSGRWNHVCFQWMGSTSVWAMFVNSKIHSVGQTAAAAGNGVSVFFGYVLRFVWEHGVTKWLTGYRSRFVR